MQHKADLVGSYHNNARLYLVVSGRVRLFRICR